MKGNIFKAKNKVVGNPVTFEKLVKLMIESEIKNISDLTKQSIFKYTVNSYKCIFKSNFYLHCRSAFIRNWNFIKYIFFLLILLLILALFQMNFLQYLIY